MDLLTGIAAVAVWTSPSSEIKDLRKEVKGLRADLRQAQGLPPEPEPIRVLPAPTPEMLAAAKASGDALCVLFMLVFIVPVLVASVVLFCTVVLK